MVQLQDSISECLHHQTFFNMLSDNIYETNHVQVLSSFGPKVSAWLTIWLIFLGFQLASSVFSTSLQIQFKLPHPLIVGIPWCVCTHLINPMGIHLLCCGHGIEHTWIHDAICDTFATIVQDVDFHVGREQLTICVFSNTFNFFRWQVNIVLTKDGICTLVDVIIDNPTWVDLLPWSCATQRFVASIVTQTKK
jgi:hypothetical protein